MRHKTFRGGTRLPEIEQAAALPVTSAPLPEKVVVPLCQHAGAPAEPAVEKGQEVLTGQLIGRKAAFISASVHSPLTGRVTDIAPVRLAPGNLSEAVTIERTGEEELCFLPPLDWRVTSPDELLERIQEAGLVGLGGAAFPTSVKFSPPKKVDTLLVNGCECEPCLSADHRLMVENTDSLLEGFRIMARILGVNRILIGIEENKPDAVRAFRERIAGTRSGNPETEIGLEVLAARYPQGAEKTLISVLLGKEVPSGGLPMDVGAVVCNIGTALAVREAVCLGKPLYERVVTVSGRVAAPANLRVRTGTSCAGIIDACGGLLEEEAVVVLGGPMMGIPLPSLDVPLTKGVSGLTVLSPREIRPSGYQCCLRCGRCVDVCPMFLQPWLYGLHAERAIHEKSSGISIADCVECGSCTYICPANRPNLQWIKLTKAIIRRSEKR